MQHFRYAALAQSVIFGAGALQELPAAAGRFGWRRLLLCTSPSQVRNGAANRVQALLGERLAATYASVQPHVQSPQVQAVAEQAAAAGVDAVIGLGGGSSVGMAKAVSIALERRRLGLEPGAALPPAHPLQQAQVANVAIPTTYAGSEMTPVVGVTTPALGTAGQDAPPRKVTLTDPRVAARLVLYDPELTLDLPPFVTASTGVNALAHAIEALYSTTRNPLSTAAAQAAIGPLVTALPACYEHGDDLAARTTLLLGAHLAGAALATVAMGVHHGACHALGGALGVPHAVAHSIMLPHTVRFNLPYVAADLEPTAAAMHLASTAAVADGIAALAQSIGLPQRLREVGVRREDLPLVAAQMLLSPAVRANPRPVRDVATALELLEAAW